MFIIIIMYLSFLFFNSYELLSVLEQFHYIIFITVSTVLVCILTNHFTRTFCTQQPKAVCIVVQCSCPTAGATCYTMCAHCSGPLDLGLRKLCRNNFGNNGQYEELGIMGNTKNWE